MVSKAKASEMVLKSFSEAAKVIQVKSLRIKKAKTLGKNINSITVKYYFFYKHSLFLYSYKDHFLSFQLIFLAQRSSFQSLSAEGEMGYGYHYVAPGVILVLHLLLNKNENLPQN